MLGFLVEKTIRAVAVVGVVVVTLFLQEEEAEKRKKKEMHRRRLEEQANFDSIVEQCMGDEYDCYLASTGRPTIRPIELPIRLRFIHTNKLLCMTPDGEVLALQDGIVDRSLTEFTVHSFAGCVALHNRNANRFLRMNYEEGLPILNGFGGIMDIDNIPDWWEHERFSFVPLGENQYALHNSSLNRFVRHDWTDSNVNGFGGLMDQDCFPPEWGAERLKIETARSLSQWRNYSGDVHTENAVRAFFARRQQRHGGGGQLRVTNIVKVENAQTLSNFVSSGRFYINPAEAFRRKGDTLLFHGLSQEAAANVQATGLLLRFAANGMLGRGLYGAPDPRKAFNFCRSDNKFMFICRYNLSSARHAGPSTQHRNSVFDEFCVYDERRVVVLWMLKLE